MQDTASLLRKVYNDFLNSKYPFVRDKGVKVLTKIVVNKDISEHDFLFLEKMTELNKDDWNKIIDFCKKEIIFLEEDPPYCNFLDEGFSALVNEHICIAP